MKPAFAITAAALLALSGCKREPVSARVDAAIAPLLPPDTVVLAGIRVDKLRSTPWLDRYVTGERALDLFQEFERRTAIDTGKELWEIDLAVTANGRLAFARGKFGGQFGLEPRIELPGMVRLNHKGYSILAAGEDAVTFFNTGVAALGRVEMLRSVIDNRDRSSAAPPALKLVETIPAKAHLWAVSPELGLLLPEVKAGGMAGNFVRLARTAGQTRVWADLSSGAEFEAEILYPDDAAAAQARDALKALLGILRLQTPPDQTALREAYANIFPSSEGPKLRVTAKTSSAWIDLALQQLLPGKTSD